MESFLIASHIKRFKACKIRDGTNISLIKDCSLQRLGYHLKPEVMSTAISKNKFQSKF